MASKGVPLTPRKRGRPKGSRNKKKIDTPTMKTLQGDIRNFAIAGRQFRSKTELGRKITANFINNSTK